MTKSWVTNAILQANERSLLTFLLARLRSIDVDVFVGHNFAAFDLDVLLHRLQHLKVTIFRYLHICKPQQSCVRHRFFDLVVIVLARSSTTAVRCSMMRCVAHVAAAPPARYITSASPHAQLACRCLIGAAWGV